MLLAFFVKIEPRVLIKLLLKVLLSVQFKGWILLSSLVAGQNTGDSKWKNLQLGAPLLGKIYCQNEPIEVRAKIFQYFFTICEVKK